MIYSGVRRLYDGWMVHWQESPALPADGGSSLVQVAAHNYGGSVEDYEWFEMTGSNYAFLLANLPSANVPMRFYFNDGEITIDALSELTHDGQYLTGSFPNEVEVTVYVYTHEGDLLLTQVAPVVDGVYSEFVIAPAGYKLVVAAGNDGARGEYTF